jgi:hypothetical protein
MLNPSLRRLIAILVLLASAFILMAALLVYTDLGKLLIGWRVDPDRPAEDRMQAPAGANEVWSTEWTTPDPTACYIDLDPDRNQSTPERGGVKVNCIPALTTKHELFNLQSQSSSLGRDRFRRVPCQNLANLPACCLRNRSGLRANAKTVVDSGEPDGNAAFGLLCRARFGCANDAVYRRGVVPWVPDMPLNCFSEANVNTCAQLLMERDDPGTYRPNLAVRNASNAATLDEVCRLDERTTTSRTVPGPELPRMTVAELRAECLSAGFEPHPDPGSSSNCPAGATGSWLSRHVVTA